MAASPERGVQAVERSAQLLLAGGHRVRAGPIWVLPFDEATPGRRQDQRGPGRRRQTFFCVDTLCPEFRLPAEAGCRCSDRDPAGHGSGISVVPLSTPGPQADRGKTAGRRWHQGVALQNGLAMLFHRCEERWHMDLSWCAFLGTLGQQSTCHTQSMCHTLHDLSGPEL